ncbi:hypothetical protein Nmel_004634 [Mimus melanotis]
MADDEKAGGSSADGGESAHCNVLSWEQVQRLDRILSETIPIHGRGNFPTLAMQPRQIVKVVRSRLEEKGIGLRDVRLNGSAASHVLHQDSGLGYKDLDLIFCADLKGEAEFQTVKDVVLDCLLDFLPEGVNKEKITPLTLKVKLPSAQPPGAGRCERPPAGSGHLPRGWSGALRDAAAPHAPAAHGSPGRFIHPTLKTEEECTVKRPDRGSSGLISFFSLLAGLLGALFYLGHVPGAAHLSPSQARQQLGVPALLPRCTGSVDGFHICKKEAPPARHASSIRLIYGTCAGRIEGDEHLEAYVQKMVKVCNDSDRWSLISLSNNSGKNVELKFVDSLRRQFEFSVDSFQIKLDSLLLFYECSENPMTETFHPTIIDIGEQQRKLESYLQNHFVGLEDRKYDYLMTLHGVVNESTVCLMGHERRQTLNLITMLAIRVLAEQNIIPNVANVTCYYQPAPYVADANFSNYYIAQVQTAL